MDKLIELIELIEFFFNRPFGVLLVVAGLVLLLAAVLLRLADIENRIVQIAALTAGTALVLAGVVVHTGLLMGGWPGLSQKTDHVTNGPPFSRTPSGEAELGGSDDVSGKKTQAPPETEAEALASPETQDKKRLARSEGRTYLLRAPVARFEFIRKHRDIRTGRIASFYRPVAPAGYRILGHHVRGKGAPPDSGGMAVSIPKDSEDRDILSYPARYERVWEDRPGGPDMGVWRPVPRPGYRCLGDLLTSDTSAPGPKDMVCVKAVLTERGKYGEPTWESGESASAHRMLILPVLPENPESGLNSQLFRAYGEKGHVRNPQLAGPFVLRKERTEERVP